MENKQTAVEWLVEQLFADNEIFGCSKELFQQAKEMEKQQIKNSYHSGTIDGFNFRTASISSISPDSEQYYNEEYGGNK